MAVGAVTHQVAVWYTISSASIPLVDLPPDETRRLPRYPTCPLFASDDWPWTQDFRGVAWGAALLADAAARTVRADAAAFTLLVDAKNDKAVAFYERFGFRALASQPRTLFLPLATARKVFVQKGAH